MLTNEKSFKMKNVMVYDYMNAAILKGELRPGDRIIIRDIAQKLEVSDIPVREAIKLLEAQGLVEVKPHSGARVRDFTLKELEEIMIVRSYLEELAIQLAVANADESAIKKMNGLIAEMENVVDAERFDKYGELNTAFHLEICRSVPFKLLFDMVSDLYAKSRIMRTTFAQSPARCRDSLHEHRGIVMAIEEKNLPKAIQLMKAHREAAWNELYRTFPDKDGAQSI